jgi:hypothetical protein
VTALRRLSLDHRTLALWLALAVLAVKLLVPAGFMVGVVDGRVGLQICSGFGPVAAAPMMHHAMPDRASTDHGTGDHGRADHPAPEMPCPFAALAHGVAIPVDPVLLAIALAFVLALGFAAIVRDAPRSVPFPRPPSRGPPVPA